MKFIFLTLLFISFDLQANEEQPLPEITSATEPIDPKSGSNDSEPETTGSLGRCRSTPTLNRQKPLELQYTCFFGSNSGRDYTSQSLCEAACL